MSRLIRDHHRVFASYLVAILWWCAFIPGFYSGDSFGVLAEASSGRISGALTAIWPLYVRVLTDGGRFPGIATLADVVILTYAMHVWCRAVLPRRTSAWVLLLMTATPLVGAMGITLWHDIPMTAGLLLLTAVTTSSAWFAGPLSRVDWTNVFAGATLAAFRPNGLPTIAGFVLLSLVARRFSRRVAVHGLAVMAIALGVSLAASRASGGPPLIHPHYAQEWMRADVSCLLSRSPDSFGARDRELLSTIGGASAWTSDSGCLWLNRPAVSEADLHAALHVIPAVWRHTAAAHPFQMASIHADRQAYLLPIPRARAFGAPFIHSTIEFSGRGVVWLNPRVSEMARQYVRIWNGGRALFAFAGFWFAGLLVLAAVGEPPDAAFGPTILMAVSLLALLFVTAPIPDARYALFVLITGQSAVVSALVPRGLAEAAAVLRNADIRERNRLTGLGRLVEY